MPPQKRTVFPTRQAVEAQGRSGRLHVSGKLKNALDNMVWHGSRRPKAAEEAGMSDHGLREALRKPHVKAYYLGQLEVLRLSERPRNIHALADVRDQTINQMARVNAIKALEALDDDTPAAGRQMMPGLAIVVTATEAKPVTIDVSPTSPGLPSDDASDTE
jgi:hypothetical protein